MIVHVHLYSAAVEINPIIDHLVFLFSVNEQNSNERYTSVKSSVCLIIFDQIKQTISL